MRLPMRSRFPRMLLALSLPVLCWTLAGCGGGGDAGDTAAPTTDDSGGMSSDTPEAMPGTDGGGYGAPDGSGNEMYDEMYADTADGSETPMPGAYDEGLPGDYDEGAAAPGGYDEGAFPGDPDIEPMPGAHDEGTLPGAPGEVPFPGETPMPGGHDEGPLPGPPGAESEFPAPGEAPAGGGHDEGPAGGTPHTEIPADPMLIEAPDALPGAVPGAPPGAVPGGELDPNGGGAAKSDLPDVPKDSAEWPAVELIRRVRAGETDSISELLYPSQRRGLIGRLASETSREKAVTELQDLFSEIIPIDARQIGNNHNFIVLNSQESAQIEFTVRRTKDGFVVYNVSSKEVSERELRTMLQARGAGGAGGAGGGNPGGY